MNVVVIKTLCKFLKRGSPQNLSCSTVLDLFGVLPFVEDITKYGYMVRLVANNNWFWSDSNRGGRDLLISHLNQVVDFNESDEAYRAIKENVENGVYGIMKPVKKEWADEVSMSYFQKLVVRFDLSSPSRTDYDNPENYYKLRYCDVNKLPFEDFKTWVIIEKMVETPINHYESNLLYSVIYGSIDELESVYMTPEYKTVVIAMKGVLAKHRAGLSSKAKDLMQQFQTIEEQECLNSALKLEPEIKALLDVPEGCEPVLRIVFQNLMNEYEELKSYMLPF